MEVVGALSENFEPFRVMVSVVYRAIPICRRQGRLDPLGITRLQVRHLDNQNSQTQSQPYFVVLSSLPYMPGYWII
jgi:hypothetical protein